MKAVGRINVVDDRIDSIGIIEREGGSRTGTATSRLGALLGRRVGKSKLVTLKMHEPVPSRCASLGQPFDVTQQPASSRSDTQHVFKLSQNCKFKSLSPFCHCCSHNT